MIQQKLELPGIDRIRTRFLEMLRDRQSAIAEHALFAWEGHTLEEVNGNLISARTILHQIAGTAGSLGFDDLGHAARSCENDIVAHLTGPDNDLALCPDALLVQIDDFVEHCKGLLH